MHLADPHHPFPLHVFRDFSAREMTQILEIMHHLFHAQTEPDIRHILQLEQTLLPCNKIVAATLSLPAMATPHDHAPFHIINVSYPTAWLTTYQQQGYHRHDPVMQRWSSTQQTFAWEHTLRKRMGPRTEEVMEEARAYDITAGAIGGRIDRRHQIGAFIAYAGGSHKDNLRYCDVIDYINSELAAALLRICPPLLNRPQLSAREREVLEGIKAGHETRAIATRLGISERTVRFHVERLLIKLRAKTRAQAIENYYASHGPSFTAAQHVQKKDSV